MIFDSDTFVKNIVEHSERITAIIEAMDFENYSVNPNILLIPSLWNNVNDALIVWAIEINHSNVDECRRQAEKILRKAGEFDSDAETYLSTMKNLRIGYTSDFPDMNFNEDDCMMFLNAYDNFMYMFYTSCTRVQRKLGFLNVDYKKICTMRETFLKNIHAAPEVIPFQEKKIAETKPITEASTENNDLPSLLRELISETRKTNELLTKLLTK